MCNSRETPMPSQNQEFDFVAKTALEVELAGGGHQADVM